jgi:hypothetical protein
MSLMGSTLEEVVAIDTLIPTLVIAITSLLE